MTIRRPLTLIDGLLRLLPIGDRLPEPDIGARVRRTTNQSIPNAAHTAISFNTVRYGPSGLWSTLEPTRLTCTVAGKYLIGGTVSFAGGGSGIKQASIYLNNSTFIAIQAGSFDCAGCSIATVYNLALNDYLQLMIYQSSGSAIDVQGVSAYSPEFYIQLLP